LRISAVRRRERHYRAGAAFGCGEMFLIRSVVTMLP
jgi:hypothetical protein